MSGHFQVTDNASLMTQDGTPNKKVWINFLPNIDLGHLLTMVGFAVAMFVQWNIMDQRVTRAEMQNSQQDQSLKDIKDDIKEIKAVVLNIQLQQAANNAVRAQVK